MKRALISVSDKTGIVEFAKELSDLGFEIVSTGGTFVALEQAGLKVIGISDVTGFPECLDGRVKTLHPNIHAGLLAVRDNPDHMAQLEKFEISQIDMVVVNLYPFKQTIAKDNVTLEEAIENIDIGGPSMLRSAAKNNKFVTVLTDPADYEDVLSEIREKGCVSVETNFRLAVKVYAHTANYDALIASYLGKQAGTELLPDIMTLGYEKMMSMRYGENPHQAAALYREIGKPQGNLVEAVQLQGKELSFNNFNDAHGALELAREFDEPTVVACKHSNPCGVGCAENIYDAYIKAYEADPVSIFGGIIVCNREVDDLTAAQICKVPLTDMVIAPSFTDAALQVFKKKKNIRVLRLEGLLNKQPETAMDIKKVSGGILVQQIDNCLLDKDQLKVVTKRQPTEKEMEDLLFAWKVVKYAKSNAIAIGKDKQTLGIGTGQVNRIWACKQAIEHCGESLGADILKGAALASDAFFPFPDCVEEAAKAGITAIIQPGGSLKDSASIEACDKHNIAMVFTEMRHFRH